MNKEALLYALVSQATYINRCDDKNFCLKAKFENKGTDTQGIFGDAFDDRLVIAFRGSEETGIADWITDLKFIPAVYPYADPPDKRVHVHLGFLGAYQSVRDAILDAAKSTTHRQIICTGHSLGGALATLSALDIARNVPGKSVSCYTYGSPKVGNDLFAKIYNKYVPRTYRFVNGADLVPTIPPGAFAHVGQLCYVGKAADRESSWTDLFASIMDRIEDHFPHSYVKGLKALL